MSLNRSSFSFSAFTLLIGVVFSGCGSAKLNCGSESGRAAIVKAVDNALNTQNCDTAVATIEPFYQDPACATDEIRYARASAYACAANINFFGLIEDMTDGDLIGSGLWQTITALFPSTQFDSRVTAANYTLDSLFAIRIPGLITPPQYLINSGTPHEGTLLVGYRKDSANVYGIFASMSLIGSLQSRYGDPDPATYRRRKVMGSPSLVTNPADRPLGWEVAEAVSMSEDACAYAGALLTFVDSVVDVGTQLGNTLGGSISTTLSNEVSQFNILFNTYCEAGCTGMLGATPIPSGCSLPSGSCSVCPVTLRSRKSCSNPSGVEACAAAGLAYFINENPLLGWKKPSDP